MDDILLTDEEFLMKLTILTERQQQVLLMRFGLYDGRKWTIEEIAEYFSTTPKRIEQIEQTALKILQTPTRVL